jgi:hypothetical protein
MAGKEGFGLVEESGILMPELKEVHKDLREVIGKIILGEWIE